ncbi:MAG: hypothetical protein AB1668_04065 [Nanoarchaeota archaeon]
MSEIDAQLEPYQGNIFAELILKEFSEPEPDGGVWQGVFETDESLTRNWPWTNNLLYRDLVTVITGTFK